MEVEVLENEIVMTEEEPQSDRHLKDRKSVV